MFIDILIRIATLSVFSLALILVFIRLCLLKPRSQSAVETGIVRARVTSVSMFRYNSAICVEGSNFAAIACMLTVLKLLLISCLKTTHSSFNLSVSTTGGSSEPL